MRRIHYLCPVTATVVLLLSGCASSGPRTVSALGFSSDIKNTSLARSAASGRAINGLHKILSETEFEWAQGEVGSRLRLSLRSEKVKYERTQFFPLAEGGWMVQAVAIVPPEIDRRHKSLGESLQTEASVTNPNIAQAYLVAEARALRKLIAQSLGGEVKPGLHTGKINLTNLIVDVDADTVTVRAFGRAAISATAALPEGASDQLLSYALRDHRIAGEWPALLAIADDELKKTPDSREFLEIAATAHLEQGQFKEAAQRYGLLKSLNKATWMKFANLQIDALRACDTEEAKGEIAKIEAEIQERQLEASAPKNALTEI